MRGPALHVASVVAFVVALGVASLAASLVGCVGRSEWIDEPPPGGGPGGGSGLGQAATCLFTSDCATGEACTRNNQCWTTSQIRTIHAVWTVSGQPASATTCTTAGDLYITFRASHGYGNQQFSFVPVPCAEGKFSIDRMSPEYDRVDLGRASSRNGGLEQGTVDATGEALIDLPY